MTTTAIARNRTAIRVMLPHHLRTLAKVDGEVTVDVDQTPTIEGVIDAIEARYPMLRGTIRDQQTRKRRSLVRFFACGTDISHESPATALPERVIKGEEPFVVIGAIAGG